MASMTIVITVTMGLYEYYRRNDILGKPTSVRQMFLPVDKWGPAVQTTQPVSQGKEASYDNAAFDYKSHEANGVISTHM